MTVKKTITGFLLTGCLSVWAAQAFGVQLIGVDKTPLPPYYQQDLFELNQLNNILMQLNAAKQMQQSTADAREEYKYQQKRLSKLDDCNVKELDKYFQNAPEVWAKMKETFATRAKEMILDFNASEPVNPNGSDEQTLAEVLSTWRLGRDVLLDVYANPEKYGKMKAGVAFPLWKDQEFLYDKQRGESYAQINTYFGEPVGNEPKPVADKYNQANANTIQKAHDDYLNQLMEKHPDKAKQMPIAFKKALLPPKALPPADEIVQYVGDISQSHQVYPEWPQPWKEFISSDFETYNLTGEMAKDFVPKTFSLNEEATVGSRAGRDNRLNQHQTVLYSVNAAKNALETYETGHKEMTDYVNDRFGIYNLSIENPDLLDVENFEKVANQIKTLKTEKIAIIRSKMAQYRTADIDWEDDQTRKLSQMSPAAQLVVLKSLPRGSDEYVKANNIIKASQIRKDEVLLNALEKDTNGVLPVSDFNAPYIDQMLKEHAAQIALEKEMRAEHKKKQDRYHEQEMKYICQFEALLEQQ